MDFSEYDQRLLYDENICIKVCALTGTVGFAPAEGEAVSPPGIAPEALWRRIPEGLARVEKFRDLFESAGGQVNAASTQGVAILKCQVGPKMKNYVIKPAGVLGAVDGVMLIERDPDVSSFYVLVKLPRRGAPTGAPQEDPVACPSTRRTSFYVQADKPRQPMVSEPPPPPAVTLKLPLGDRTARRGWSLSEWVLGR